MADDILHVLFVSAGNSSRSIMAEAMLNKLGRKNFLAFSAGITPDGEVKSLALDTLMQTGCDTSDLHVKSWDEFAAIQAPRIDAVILMEQEKFQGRFPIRLSNPVVVHWRIPPVEGPEMTDIECQYAYRRFFAELEQLMLRLAGLDLGHVRGYDLEISLNHIAP